MKMKKAIIRSLIVIMVVILGIGIFLPSLAVTNENKELVLEHFRYVNGNPTNGYQIQVAQGDPMQSLDRHPVFQIMSTNKNNDVNLAYYCLNALYGSSWNRAVNERASINNVASYPHYFDLDSESDIQQLKNSTNEVYKNIVNNPEKLSKILWILNNAYIANNNAEQKRSFLAKAGIVYEDYAEGSDIKSYRYKPQDGYNYMNKITETDAASEGWLYTDNNGNYVNVELTDDLIEVSQQLALWYYTNCLDNNESNSTAFNFKQRRAELYKGIYNVDEPTGNWQHMEDYKYENNQNGRTYHIGSWLEDQATILTSYLIDAANNYASSSAETGNPLELTPQPTAELNVHGDYYVIGALNIHKKREAVFDLNTMTVKSGNNTITGAFISDANGNRKSDQTIANYIDKDFYVAVPKSKVNGSSINISFDGTYDTIEKKLWVNEAAGEQPIVEITPKKEPFELKVTAPVIREFDLALRKRIIAINGKSTGEDIKNEAGLSAVRATDNIDTSSIPNTATYKHRKDPVVVKKGDSVKYSITVYNEGEIDGYAKTIVDKLPQGLVLKGFTENKTTTGTYKKGNINYSYVYDKNNNTITFTNVSENILPKYEGTLASETIEIECEIVYEPSTKTNNYLTNIAYVSEAYKKETETPEKVVQDRDSNTSNYPQINQNTTGDKYTGYHGGDNTKDVYSDTNNNVYFPGQEDDDDFEIVVIKPAEFDLALKKYITNVISPDGTMKPGKNAPTINTRYLKPNGNEKTAQYDLDTSVVKVKSGDYVLYTITVYNEGEIDGYVKNITDNIPIGLEFVIPKGNNTITKVDSQGNSKDIEVSDAIYQKVTQYNDTWSIDHDENNNPIKDSYKGKETISITCDVKNSDLMTTSGTTNGKGFLKAYDSSKDQNYDGSGLDRLSVQVLLRVGASDASIGRIRNEAAITKVTLDEEGKIVQDTDFSDRDSQTDQWPGKEPGDNYQDDEDWDHIELEKVDLALTKFITAISDDIKIEDGEYLTKDKTSQNAGSKTNPFDRATEVETNPLLKGETDAKYTLKKTSEPVPAESYILYNIRVYNEGDVDVYAGEVTDYLPNYLTFVQGNFNDQYGWKEVSRDENGTAVKTDYLSYEKNKDKILKAFNYDGKDDGYGSSLDYEDLPILCRIKADAPNKTKLINSAEISKYQDENGQEIETDIDSQPDNLPDDKKNKEGNPEGRYDQDDEDYEVVEVIKKRIDLALTKFIIAVSEDEKIEDGEYLTDNGSLGSIENPYNRATEVETNPLLKGETDAKYTLKKTSEPVPAESYVLYNIRVYNEGEVDVYAGEVKDYLPDYLQFVDNDAEQFNKKYGWSISSDGKTVTTNYLSYEKNKDKILKAFNYDGKDDGFGSRLDYEDLPILCKIKADAPKNTKLINSSEITKYENKDGNEIEEDIDSRPENLPDDNKNKEGKPEGRYNEDDEDYEVIEVIKKRVDLALKKFITAVSNDIEITDGEYLTENGSKGSKENPYKRAPEVKTQDLKNKPDCHDAEYIMVKDPLTVPARSYVLYNIRVYNEGETDVYAGEVTDYLPDYLDYVDCQENKKYGWTVASDGKTISTKYLSFEVNKDKILKAFDKKNDDEHGSGLSYQDLPVVCRVNEKAPTNTNIVNIAEITRYENKDGDPIPDDDIDSRPKNYEQKNEDDDDYEVILIKKFDLSLLKYVTEVYITEDGKTKTIQTGNTGDDSKDIIPKVEINKKKLNSTIVKFGYTIKITNEGEIEGYAKEITDYVPEGLKFYAEDNNGWKDEGNNIISTRLLENTLLKPGESAEVKVIFRWINGSNNLGLKTNTAEISEDYNKYGVPDIDSVPDNKKYGEDDIDDAKVILSIKTGLVNNIVMYSTIGLVILVVMGTGIVAIKKYVL